ncbi:MAG TPA: carbohydrate-binding protein, partial [Tepidisphaeraceae bacterium]|nr:carbohydrate-binding protein [Tepidisphaeraceae bacterium]
GQMYDLHLDYFERAGGASAQLSWSSPTTPKQIIPESQLDPNPRIIQQPPPPLGDQKPFKGAAFNVGDRIEAEDYDIGGEGVSFHDVDSANRGGKYRSDAVDIEVSSAGGYDVAYATAGEWLEYTINVPSDGNYALDIATASYAFAGTFHIDVDGLAALGPITVPATGGWQKWQVLHAAGLKLTAGTHVMRLSFDTNGPSGSFANVDYLRLTPAPAPGVDLMIRNRKEASYSGDNVYTTNGGMQQRSQSTNFYPATYELRIENDGTAADSFIIKSNFEPAPGWRVSYYEINPGVPANPISLAGDGWNTGVLNPGEFKRINVDVAPSPKAGGGATRGFDITATAALDPANTDVARTITTLSSVRLPEIRRRNTASDNTYLLEVQNKGNVSDALRITGPTGGTGFTLKYFDDYEAGNDITAAVTSGGWLTPKLAANAHQDIRVQILPSTSDVHTFTITATSVGDAGKRDTVTISDRSPNVKQPPFFVIGAWSQPTSLFGRWKNRGINTLMHFEPEGGRVSIDQWTAAANAAGLYMIRKPRDNPAD